MITNRQVLRYTYFDDFLIFLELYFIQYRVCEHILKCSLFVLFFFFDDKNNYSIHKK